MKKLILPLVAVAATFLFAVGHAVADNAGDKPLRFAVTLTDTSRIIGVPAVESFTLKTDYGDTPLHLAVQDQLAFLGLSREKLVKWFLEKGASVNVVDEEGFTPLHRAVIEEAVDVARILLQAGADPNAKSGEGESPLSLTEEESDMGKLLVEFGAK